MDGIVVGDAQSIQPAELLAEVRDIEHESRAVSTDRALKLAGMYGAWHDYSHRDGAPWSRAYVSAISAPARMAASARVSGGEVPV